MRQPVIAAGIAATLALAGCGNDSRGDEHAASPPGHELLREPDDTGSPGVIVVGVTSTERLRDLFDYLRVTYNDDDRGYLVSIVCAAGDSRPQLARGRYANGDRGAAQTGLSPGEAQFTRRDEECPAAPTARAADADVEEIYRAAARRDADDFASGARGLDRPMSIRVARLLVNRCDAGRSVPKAVCAQARREVTETLEACSDGRADPTGVCSRARGS